MPISISIHVVGSGTAAIDANDKVPRYDPFPPVVPVTDNLLTPPGAKGCMEMKPDSNTPVGDIVNATPFNKTEPKSMFVNALELMDEIVALTS